MNTNDTVTTTVVSIAPFLGTGTTQVESGGFFLNTIEFKNGEKGPVFSQKPEPPYAINDTVDIIKKVNKAGKVFYTVSKVSPFPKEEVETKVETIASPVYHTDVPNRNTLIAISATDKAIALTYQQHPKETPFDLNAESVRNDVTKMAMSIMQIITKVEKNVL